MQVRKVLNKLAFCLILFGSNLPTSQAQTVVTFSTSVGDFSIQLFDEFAPITVNNFLNYVTSNRYNGTIVHRTEPGFVIQGGFLSVDAGTNSVSTVNTDNSILNEPFFSNTRGTVAMAKIDGDPNSATSQWFINLADNISLDAANGGFTVFGQVINDGMTVVDQIANLPAAIGIGGLSFAQPLVNYQGGVVQAENFVYIDATVSETFPPNSFNSTTGKLNFRIDAESLGLLGLSFVVDSEEPEVVIRALAETVLNLGFTQGNFATFDPATGVLTIPELIVGGEVAFRNLVLTLTDANQLLFTLQSFE